MSKHAEETNDEAKIMTWLRPAATAEELTEIHRIVSESVASLERPHPDQEKCSHLGVFCGATNDGYCGWRITMSKSNTDDNRLLVKVYGPLSEYMPNASDEYPESWYASVRAAVAGAAKSKELTHWNGFTMSGGVSVVLARSAPESLVRAQNNYVAFENDAAYEAWDEWFCAGLQSPRKIITHA